MADTSNPTKVRANPHRRLQHYRFEFRQAPNKFISSFLITPDMLFRNLVVDNKIVGKHTYRHEKLHLGRDVMLRQAEIMIC